MENKGLVAQIEERGKVISSDKFTKEHLIELFNTLEANEVKSRLKKEKQRKEDEKWLIAKSKELGEPIPWMLGYYAHTQQVCYHIDFVKMYPDWFKEIKPYIINRKYNEDALRDYFIKEYKNK